MKADKKDNGSNCLGFRFTEEEEARMDGAMRSAAAFMRRYGRGRRPYMVDLSKYVMHVPKIKK